MSSTEVSALEDQPLDDSEFQPCTDIPDEVKSKINRHKEKASPKLVLTSLGKEKT